MKQIFSLVLLALSALLACCTQDELPGGSVIPPGYSLYVSSTVIGSGSHSETEVSTRAGSVLVPVTKGSLGIFRSKGAGYSGELNNIEYTYTGAAKGWQPTATTDTILLNGGDADVCAYYPYDGAMNFIDKTRMPIYSGKYTGNYSAVAGSFVYDLCYDINRTLNGSKRATTFEMKHAMAMLEFKITKDAGYQGDCRVTSVSILNPNLITESAIDISSGTYATTSSKGTVAYNPGDDADGILIGSTAATTSALLVPFTPDADGITLSFAVNDMPVTANIGTDKLPKVEAGNRYTVKLTMKATSMEVTGVDMLPWEETGVGGDGFTWYPTEEVPAHTIDIGLDFYIADGNLRATKETGSSSYTYAFAEGQGYYSGVDGAYNSAGGDYFCWNWDDPAVTDKNQGSWDDTRDPCRMVDDGKWRTPTQAELQALVDAGNVWGDGTYKMKNGAKKSGRYFGTTTVPPEADQDKYVFLPAAGSRHLTKWGGAGRNGFYWSSTPGGTGAYYIDFDSSGIIPEAYDYSSSGFSLRCVHDK